jgi:hypothetical protein
LIDDAKGLLHAYLPFGEPVASDLTTANGYSNVKQAISAAF